MSWYIHRILIRFDQEPAYNESDWYGELIRALPDLQADWHLIDVDLN